MLQFTMKTKWTRLQRSRSVPIYPLYKFGWYMDKEAFSYYCWKELKEYLYQVSKQNDLNDLNI